nr:lipase family protein [Acidimicrobiales bacterium]
MYTEYMEPSRAWAYPVRFRSRARHRVRLAVAVVLLALVAGMLFWTTRPTTADALAAPSGDAFYTPPSPLPAGRPGDIIWARPSSFYPVPLVRSSVNAWQVMYRSTSATGQPIAVTGTVLVPRTWYWGPRPIVGFANGTQGVGDSCAPSKSLAAGLNYEGAFIQNLLNKGWAVAITDYEGLGTPGDHTYVVGRSEGAAVLDSVRAATRLPGSGLSTTAPVGLMGYSQGGGAVGWAAELAPSYAPELPIKGVAAGGVPADLLQVADLLDGGLGFGLLASAALGFDAAYTDLDLAPYLNDAGRAAFADARDECVGGLVLKFPFRSVAEYTVADPLRDPAWLARLNENRLGSTAPKVPVLLYHSKLDELVAYPQAVQLRRDWC